MLKLLNTRIIKQTNEKVITLGTQEDIAGKEYFLNSIKHNFTKEIGSSNYSYDIIQNYDLEFRVNCGKGQDKCFSYPDIFIIFTIEFNCWYRDNLDIIKELSRLLADYPIIYLDEVLEAFKYREYYK